MKLRVNMMAVRGEEGLTLIEIIVVVAILGLLATTVAPSVFQHVGTAKETAARSQIELLGAALDAYRLDNDQYPMTAQGLEALRVVPAVEPLPRRWRGPYIKRDVPADPWNRPYVYLYPGEVNPMSYDLLSLGRDGEPGGEGEDADILSWQ